MPSLLCIALGAFAIGTEGFMLAGLLPAIAADVAVSPQGEGVEFYVLLLEAF